MSSDRLENAELQSDRLEVDDQPLHEVALAKSGEQTQIVVKTDTRPESYEIKYGLVGRPFAIFFGLCAVGPFLAALVQLIIRGAASPSVLVGLIPPMLVFAGLIAFAFLYSARVVLTKEGLKFSMHWFQLGRRMRSWDDLHSIQMIYPVVAVPEDSPLVWQGEKAPFKSLSSFFGRMYSPWLLLDFSSGGTARILLNRLNRKQAQDLFSALETWSSPSKFSTEVLNLERSLVLGTDEIPSFTKIWEDQLNAQYVSTNYVPLPTNHMLQSGAYEILMQLAAGGMSAVYLAKDKNGKKLVIKEAVAPPDSDERQVLKSRELFQREAKLLMKLNHPQIAKVYDYFVERDRDYLVLEYVKGSTLKQLIKEEGKQKEARVLQWSRQIAETIEYLHAQNPPVLHRDLTPDNLILGEKGQIKLVDFGAASEYVGSATGTFIGKQCYIPPEQLRGKAVPQSDLYALGGTMQFLLTGKDPMALSQSHPREIDSSISEKTDQLVASLTAAEASARPQSAAALLLRIDELAPGAKKAHSSKPH